MPRRIGTSRETPTQSPTPPATPPAMNQRRTRRPESGPVETPAPASSGSTLHSAHAWASPLSSGMPGRNSAASGKSVASPADANTAAITPRRL